MEVNNTLACCSEQTAKRMNVSSNYAAALLQSESAHIMNEAAFDTYKALGVDEYEVIETLDSHTCGPCGDMDGRHFPVSEKEPGVNCLPFHTGCRGFTVPYFDDEFTVSEKRAARDEDGKIYYTDGDITYKKWRENGIIKSNNGEMAVADVHYIGKLDKNIYKCVTEDIRTEDVIITDTQVKHIKEHHPNDYERYFKYASEIIKSPDYILEANKPNTAFLLKHINGNNKNYQLILRLKTSQDPIEYKNSVITFLKVEEKRYERYLRTKKCRFVNDVLQSFLK